MDRGAAAENHEAVRLLFELFAPKVLAAAFFVIRDRELAEDIMQDTFLTAMHKLHQLHDREKAGAWLTRIAINKAHSEMRKKNRATVADPCVAVPDDTDQALLIEEDAKRLHQAMEQLNADHKLVLHMKYFEELSVKTIAETLELPEGTVKTRLRRARELVGTYYGRKVRVSG